MIYQECFNNVNLKDEKIRTIDACLQVLTDETELFEELFSYTCILNIQFGLLKENDNNEQINTIKVARKLLNHYDTKIVYSFLFTIYFSF